MTSTVECDLLIIGAGPTGLFAAYYGGFRGYRVAVVDSLPELGGQITAMYPEKQILDVGGLPDRQGQGPRRGSGGPGGHRQARRTSWTAPPQTLSHDDDGVTVGLDDGTEVRAGR